MNSTKLFRILLVIATALCLILCFTACKSNTVQSGQNDSLTAAKNKEQDASGGKSASDMDFKTYSALNADEQYAFFLTFEDPEAFLLWHNAAKAEYDKSHPAVPYPEEGINLEQ